LKLIIDATSLGGFHTTIYHYGQFDTKIDKSLLRLSVGIENIEDLWKDIRKGLDAVVELTASADWDDNVSDNYISDDSVEIDEIDEIRKVALIKEEI
jgi:hypothetical protein